MPRTLDPKKYRDVITYLQRHFALHEDAPSYDEIVAGAGLSSKCLVKPYLAWLIRDRLVQKEPDRRRSLRLTDSGRSYPNRPRQRQRVAAYESRAARINAAAVTRLVTLPVVGRTFAGQTTPIPNTDFSTFDAFETIEVSEDILPPRSKWDRYFVLEVRGDSMIEAEIYDGDYVICRMSDVAENNQMVVALLEDSNETTLKYFFKEKDHIRLQPANSAMQPILIYDTTHLVIQGVVERVVHCRE